MLRLNYVSNFSGKVRKKRKEKRAATFLLASDIVKTISVEWKHPYVLSRGLGHVNQFIFEQSHLYFTSSIVASELERFLLFSYLSYNKQQISDTVF